MRNIRRAALAGRTPVGVATERIPRYVTMLGSCYSLSGVCELTASDAQTVQMAVERRSLVAVDTQQARSLFPVWQFPKGSLLPHLPEILAALPADRLGPWDTALWFTRRRKALRGDSAAQWLRYGGDPETVRALAAA